MEASELIERFCFFDDWQDRYRYIIELGRKLPHMEDSAKSEQTRVKGCMSQVWMISRLEDAQPPTIHFVGDSDSHIVKGLIAILLHLYSGLTADQILEIDIEKVFGEIGLDEHLSPNRRNGFFSMVQRMRAIASMHVDAA